MQLFSQRHSIASFADFKVILVSSLILFFAFGWLIAIYSNIVNHNFLNWDDTLYIVNNPHLRGITVENLYWMLTDVSTINWHPLTWLVYNIEFYIYGDSAVMFKLTNIIIHTVNCVILYLLFKKILEISITSTPTNGTKINYYEAHYSALLAACLFAIHPQHIESVVWVSETKDVLCALFYSLTLLSYLKYKSDNNTRFYYGAVIFALFATLSKPMAVSIPAALVILDIFLFPRDNSGENKLYYANHLLLDKIPFIVFALFIAVITLVTQSLAIKDLDTIGLLNRFINSNIATLHYLGTLILPANLSPFYPYSDISLKPSLGSALPIAVNLAIIAMAVKLRNKQQPLYLLSLIFFYIAILPVIGFITVGHQAYADRYSYIPTSIFYLAIANSFIKLSYNFKFTKTFRAAFSLLLLVFTCLIGITSTHQVKAWASDETLWSTVVNRFPNKVFIAHQNLGNTYLTHGYYTHAIKQYNIALQLNPDSAKTYENMGRAYAGIGDEENEIKQYVMAIKKDDNSPWPYLFAGNYYLQRNNLQLATKYLEKAYDLNPYSSSIIIANAKLGIMTKNTASAKSKLKELLMNQPDNVQAMQLLSHIYRLEGNEGMINNLLENIDNRPVTKNSKSATSGTR